MRCVAVLCKDGHRSCLLVTLVAVTLYVVIIHLWSTVDQMASVWCSTTDAVGFTWDSRIRLLNIPNTTAFRICTFVLLQLRAQCLQQLHGLSSVCLSNFVFAWLRCVSTICKVCAAVADTICMAALYRC
jgi:hypothetical protein